MRCALSIVETPRVLDGVAQPSGRKLWLSGWGNATAWHGVFGKVHRPVSEMMGLD